MDDAYYAEQLEMYQWWSLRTDKLLNELRGRLEADAAQRGLVDSPFKFYDAMRGQAEFTIIIDSIAATLSRALIPITTDERDLFRELMYKIEHPDPMFRFLHDRDNVMSALNVVDELPSADPDQQGNPGLEVRIDRYDQAE
ncbi:hypothetical protein ACWIGW_00520 [Nocardia brasiliensis]